MKKDTELKYRYLHLFVHICIVIVTLFSFSQVRIRDLVQVSAGGIEGKYTDILNLEIYKNTDLVFEKNKIQQSENTEELAVLIDEYANYKPDSFRNHTLIVNESSYPILAHSESAILVKAKPSELIKAVGDSTRYKIQNNKTLGVLKKLYSKMPKVPITPVEPFLALACIILAYINRHFLGQHFKQYKLLYALILLIPATLAFSLLISS